MVVSRVALVVQFYRELANRFIPLSLLVDVKLDPTFEF